MVDFLTNILVGSDYLLFGICLCDFTISVHKDRFLKL